MTDEQDRLDELESEVEAMQERFVEDQLESAALRQLVWGLADGDAEDYDTIVRGVHSALETVESMGDRLEQLEAANERLRTRLDKLGDIGEQKTSKEEKIATIVTYAHNQRREGQDAVTVLPKVINGLVDVSRRYAYDLVDGMIREYDWAHDPANLDRYGSIQKKSPRKGVCIDFAGVHGEAVSVNKFTTTSAEMGVAD